MSDQSDAAIHGGLVDNLLAAATREDELVTKLLRASLRGDWSGTVKLARAIAEHRGVLKEQPEAVAGDPHTTHRVRYEDKLLAAVHREEILIESLIATSAKGERSTLFSLCRKLTKNRKSFDPEFHRKTNTTTEPDL